jgi:hypothetical protein
MLMAADDRLTRSASETERETATTRAGDVDRALELLADADRLRLQAAELLGPLADSDLAQWLGYVSMERLVAHQTGSRNTVARGIMRVARFLEKHPVSAAALREGRLSWAHAEALAHAAAGDRSGRFTEHEEQLLNAAEGASPEEFDRLVHAWRSRVDAELDAADAERSWRTRSLTMQLAFDGSSLGRFRLDPVATEIVAAALESPPDPITTLPEPRTLAQRRADALVDLCQSSNSTSAEIKTAVDVVVDIETLAGADTVTVQRLRRELASGGPISGPGLDRLMCDASFRTLVTDGPRTVLAYNRATPDIPPALRRAVRIRDRNCTFAGCDRPHRWCDLHHIVPRSRGGPTTIENLTLLCRFHHTTVHEGGWQLTRAPDGTIRVNSP